MTQENSWPTVFYGTAWKKEATAGLVEQAIAAGYRAIDTAAQPQHYNEAGVGEGVAAAMASQGLERGDLFLQTKFSPLMAQGAEAPPYAVDAAPAQQVEESLQSSLAHFGTDYLDSLLLHGPQQPQSMTALDWEIWAAIEDVCRRGIVRHIGISNIGPGHLQDLLAGASVPPMAVQNRCFAHNGWDRAMRIQCAENGVAYQGFSLLTANPFVLKHPEVGRIAAEQVATPAQIVFAFARRVGMIPLTGTTSRRHMADDLRALEIELSDEDAALLERIGQA